jgi:hypothetical protein
MRNPIWTPSEDRKKRANLTDFMRQASENYHRQFLSYDELHDWSINYPTEFWAFLWQYLGIKASRQYDSVITTAQHMMHTRWFTGARLNFAENLLRYRDNRTAIIFKVLCRICRRPLSPCWPPPVSALCGHPALLILASKAHLTDSGRWNQRYFLPLMATCTMGSLLIR